MGEKYTYGTEEWTIDEIFNQVFKIGFDETLGIPELKRVGAELARTHHRVSFEAAKATELLGQSEEAVDTIREKITEEVRRSQEKILKRTDRLTEKQRISLVNNKIETFIVENKKRKYEVSLWNRVLESLKYVAKRVDTLTIIESVEAKMMSGGHSDALLDKHPLGKEEY